MSDKQNNVLANNPEVQAEIKHREAVHYLRQRDCSMLSELKNKLEENIKLQEKLNAIKMQIAELQKNLRTPQPKINKKMLMIGLLLLVVGIVLFAFIPFLVVAAIVGAVLTIIALVKNAKAKKSWKDMMDQTRVRISEEEKNAQAAQANIDNHWKTVVMAYINESLVGRFPVEYAVNYNAVCYILYMITNMRADNIKEAINLYEDILFRNQAIATLTESVRYAARTAVASERSARANEATAKHTADTAAAAAATAAAAAATAANTARINSTLSGGVNVNVEHSGSVSHYIN